jgi:hypothetical protein
METPTFRSGNRGAVYPDYALGRRSRVAALAEHARNVVGLGSCFGGAAGFFGTTSARSDECPASTPR